MKTPWMLAVVLTLAAFRPSAAKAEDGAERDRSLPRPDNKWDELCAPPLPVPPPVVEPPPIVSSPIIPPPLVPPPA